MEMRRFMNLLETPVRLDEMYYRDIMQKIDPNWLPHKDYAPLVPFVQFIGHRKDIFKFFVPNRYNGWSTYIRFTQFYDMVSDTETNAVEAARLLLWGSHIKFHCPCPAFKFWGQQFVATQHDAAIIPEDRFPHIRNPLLKGIACKHLRRTLKVLGFHLGDMAAAIKEERKRPG